MWRLCLLLTLDMLLLQPIRCVIGFVLRYCWHPPRCEALPAPRPWPQVQAAVAARLESLDRDLYGQDMDAAKWLGMLSAATGAQGDWYKGVTPLLDDYGDIKRCLADPYPADAPPFSGDMASGLILAITARLHRLTPMEEAYFRRLWERTTWEGWPLLFSTPGRGKRPGQRGHIWRPWYILGTEDILGTLCWLYLGWRVTGELRYRVAYHVMRTLMAPSLLLATSDAQVWLGRVYATHPSTAHSNVLVYYAGWRLTGDLIFRRALATAYKRHAAYSADVAVLAGSAIDAPGWRDLAKGLISAALDKGTRYCPEDKTYLSLVWPPAIVRRASSLQAPESRGADYLWERSPIKGQLLDDAYRAGRGLDVIFPALMMSAVLGGRDLP